MAKKVTVTLVDDFDGAGAADETVEFGLDGVSYEIDLSAKNAAKLRNELKPWLEDESVLKVWHNYGFDRHVLHNHNVNVMGFGGDTMHMARCV